MTADATLVELIGTKLGPLAVLFLIGITIPVWIWRIPPFRRMRDIVQGTGRISVKAPAYNGPVERFRLVHVANGQVVNWHHARALMARVNTEVNDIVRTCCLWLFVHITTVIVVVALIAATDLGRELSKRNGPLELLAYVLALPLTEVLALLFFTLSLNRLAQDWDMLKEELEYLRSSSVQTSAPSLP